MSRVILEAKRGGPLKAHFHKSLNPPLFEILIIILLLYRKQKKFTEKTQIIYMLNDVLIY